jgi:tRNA(Ile)-lysidine synthase
VGGFSAAALCDVLAAHAPEGVSGWVVAVSGGTDSACLLQAMAAQPGGMPVRAVHVDHGLQTASPHFTAACADQCRQLAIPLTVLAVLVDTDGTSLEAAARDARYAAFARNLRPGECLLTAHHTLDQAETLLLQLLRGAGLKGLSAMPISRPLGLGWHLRPLLEVAKRDLLEFAETAGIASVADPMNTDLRFDRAYLRARLWPLIEQRWPGAAHALARSASHAADAQELLDQAAAMALQRVRDGSALSVRGLRSFSSAEQLSVLRYWISERGLAPPSTARLKEALRQINEAANDHLPTVTWGEHALRRYRDRLFLTEANPPALREANAWAVQPAARLALGAQLGTLCWAPQLGGLDAARLPQLVVVKPRAGGEMLKPAARAKTQSVQHLCQSLGVVPWMRAALPLVYAGEALIAVGDLWLDARWCVAASAHGVGCVWEGAPVLV